MAEFQEIAIQRNRMCSSYVTCDMCELTGLGCMGTVNENLDKIERIIMDWAAAHPEPRYPTWNEWYQECLPDAPFKCRRAFMYTSCGTRACDACLSEPIPADIAQKLGIKPITEERVDK